MKKVFISLFVLILFNTIHAQQFAQIDKLVASDRDSLDNFGAVAIDGDYAVVGAINEDEDAFGGNTLSGAGSAYIYKQDSTGTWIEVQKIVASDRDIDDAFGISVAISGQYMVAGAFLEDEDTGGINTILGAGSAYIFEQDLSGNWLEVQKIVASDRGNFEQFGGSLAISGDYIIVGAALNDLDTAGNNFILSAGAAYIFKRDGLGVWSEVQKIVASDRGFANFFGNAVDIDEDYAIVGARNAGAGASYVFEKSGSSKWIEKSKLTASDGTSGDFFGKSVSISGNYAIVGADYDSKDASGGNLLLRAGSAYLFERNTLGIWNESAKIDAPDRAIDDFFGVAVSIKGNYALIGARLEDENTMGSSTMLSAGSAYLFKRDVFGTWSFSQKIVASDREAGATFGGSVAMDCGNILIGAEREHKDNAGLNDLSDAGAAYLYYLPINDNPIIESMALCFKDTIIILDTNDIAIWSGLGIGDSTKGIFEAIIAGAGNHTIQKTYASNCFGNIIDSTSITLNPNPIISIDIKDDSCSNSKGNIDVELLIGVMPVSYLWNTGNVNPDITDLVAGEYVITTSDAIGCSTTDTIAIIDTVSNCNLITNIYVPNAFSPNNDGYNDNFLIQGEGIDNLNLKIFNRWGENIFESTDKNIGWNGYSNKNKLENEGVYLYVITGIFLNGVDINKKGNVALIR